MIYQERIRTAELRGIEIGRAQGIAQGIAKGDRQVLTDMIRRMLDEKLPVDLIMRVSGLQLSEIEEIEKQTVN